MRKFGKDKFQNCLKKLRRGDEEKMAKTSFKIVLEFSEEAMRKLGRGKF